MDHHNTSSNTDGWRCMERPLVSMIFMMIRAKAPVPHETIRVELAPSPLVVEALTRSVSFMHTLWDLSRHRYACLALESSRQLHYRGILLVGMDRWHHGFGYTISVWIDCLLSNTLWIHPLSLLHVQRSRGSFVKACLILILGGLGFNRHEHWARRWLSIETIFSNLQRMGLWLDLVTWIQNTSRFREIPTIPLL